MTTGRKRVAVTGKFTACAPISRSNLSAGQCLALGSVRAPARGLGCCPESKHAEARKPCHEPEQREELNGVRHVEVGFLVSSCDL